MAFVVELPEVGGGESGEYKAINFFPSRSLKGSRVEVQEIVPYKKGIGVRQCLFASTHLSVYP